MTESKMTESKKAEPEIVTTEPRRADPEKISFRWKHPESVFLNKWVGGNYWIPILVLLFYMGRQIVLNSVLQVANDRILKTSTLNGMDKCI